MKELSLNILDIAKNSVTAGASLITVSVLEAEDSLTISVADNGCGMSEEFVKRVTDPFTTTRTTRKVGMGLPLLKMVAEMCGGHLTVSSALGVGTTTTAVFQRNHIDLPPLGDLAGSIVTLIQGSPDIDFLFVRKRDGEGYELDTRQLREIMGDVLLSEPEVLQWIQDFITENEQELNVSQS